MADEYDIDDILDELDQEDEAKEHEAEIVEAEAKAEREDKVARKISKSYEELDKKMDAIELQRVMDKFDDSSDDTEKLIMGTVRADLKDPARALEAIKMVREKAAELRKKQEEREAELLQQAEERAAKAWGIGPVGKPAAPADAEKELMERISKGDTRALVESIIGDDLPF